MTKDEIIAAFREHGEEATPYALELFADSTKEEIFSTLDEMDREAEDYDDDEIYYDDLEMLRD